MLPLYAVGNLLDEVLERFALAELKSESSQVLVIGVLVGVMSPLKAVDPSENSKPLSAAISELAFKVSESEASALLKTSRSVTWPVGDALAKRCMARHSPANSHKEVISPRAPASSSGRRELDADVLMTALIP
jgi:hypothetical protein